MPFIPRHLSTEEVEAVYIQALREIELCEVRGWVSRIADLTSDTQLADVTRAREALEKDLEQSRACWARGKPEGE